MSLLGLGGPNESTKEKEKENEFKMTKKKETRQERVENVGMVMGGRGGQWATRGGEKREESRRAAGVADWHQRLRSPWGDQGAEGGRLRSIGK
jgi:hypothetical protein